MLWLALYCPELPWQVFTGLPPAPVAVVEADGRRETLVAVNPAARADGLYAGMALAAARARRPDLVRLTRAPAAERNALRRLAAACLQLSDHVAPEPPAGLVLEIGRSRALFGGLDPLLAAADRLLARHGLAAVRGVAPTPAAARLLARSGGGRVEAGQALAAVYPDLPAACLAPDENAARRLRDWGVTTLAGCLALPRAGLARRLGRDFVTGLDRISGRQPETVPRFAPPPRFAGRLALADEGAGLDQVLVALAGLCGELEDWLRARDAAIPGLRVALQAPRGAVTRVRVGLARPTRDAGHLRALLRERLERGEPGAPTIAVGLVAERPVRYTPPSRDLWLDAGREPPERLLERLRARLGPDAVLGLTLLADHRPERAWRWSEPGAPPAHEPGVMPPRPAWLLSEPAPLAVDAEQWPRLDGPLELLDGPERIESGWWDGGDIARDYFIARSRPGPTLWIFRQRRPPRAWFVHGLFG